jgi:hypothetical protein
MTSNDTQGPEKPRDLEDRLLEAAKKAAHFLEPNSLGVMVRKPLLDEDCPEVSDVDLISIWEKPEELPERMTIENQNGRVFVDLLWIPVSKIFDPQEAASYKTLPHLLLEYENIWIRSDPVKSMIENIKLNTFDREVWAHRIHHQINFGDAALEEAQKNLDYPPAVLFFLQTAHAYYITGLADCLKRSTMSLLTRPVTKLRRMSAETKVDLERLLRSNLHLDLEPSAPLAALRRVFNNVSARCAGRQLRGASMRARGHYAYTISPLELEYRESVAKALVGRGDYANANFYLRFWAYSLSRCPVVLEEARTGRKPSFYVPFEPFKKSVLATCPEILDDMKTILGGEIPAPEVKEATEGTVVFKNLVVEQIQARGIRLK